MNLLIKASLFILLISSIVSCKKSDQETQIEVISGNVTYNSLIQSDGENYFVLDQNKIRLLNISNPEMLNISSTFPLTEIAFESIRGNKDTLYIQTAKGLKIYKLTNEQTTNWQEVATIEGILPCDKFDVNYPFLLTSVRNASCNFSENNVTEIRLYNIAKLDSTSLQTATATAEVIKIQKDSEKGFYALSSDGKISRYFVDNQQTKHQLILDIPDATDFSFQETTMLVTSKTTVSQYRLDAGNNAQLLSSIPISQ